LPDGELLTQSKMLLREVATRPAPEEALRHFITMAQGRQVRPVSVVTG
jgi:hypothetical protein